MEEEKTAKSLQKQLNCPVCYHTLTESVFQCTNGHLICNSCLDQIQNPVCPSCRCDLSEPIRCRPIELMLQSVPLPCEYGCGFSGVESARTKHTKEDCPNCTVDCYWYDCSPSNCGWQGDMKELKQHMIDVHKFSFHLRENGKFHTLIIDRERDPMGFWHCFVDGVALILFEYISDYTISWVYCAIDNNPRGTVTFRSNANDKRSVEITIPIISIREYKGSIDNEVGLSFFANNEVEVCYNIE